MVLTKASVPGFACGHVLQLLQLLPCEVWEEEGWRWAGQGQVVMADSGGLLERSSGSRLPWRVEGGCGCRKSGWGCSHHAVHAFGR